jgi:hypothetical protein
MKDSKHFICYHKEEGSFLRTGETRYVCAIGFHVHQLNRSSMKTSAYSQTLYKFIDSTTGLYGWKG